MILHRARQIFLEMLVLSNRATRTFQVGITGNPKYGKAPYPNIPVISPGAYIIIKPVFYYASYIFIS